MAQTFSYATADDAMQMDVYQTLCPFYTTKKTSHITVTIKTALR